MTQASNPSSATFRTSLAKLGSVVAAPLARAGRLARSLRFWIFVFLVLLALIIVYYALAEQYTPITTDAYVQAYVVQVAPQVEGRVVRVAVKEGDEVKAGDLLFELDPRPFQHKADQLAAERALADHGVLGRKADLAAAKAEHERAEADSKLADIIYQQEKKLIKSDSTTERKFKEAELGFLAKQAAVSAAAAKVTRAEQALAARVGDQDAQVAQASAHLGEARLNLDYTRVYAPCAGLITDLQLREGAYVRTGEPALTVIDTGHWQVVANLRENSLGRLQVGQPALVSLRGAPGRLLTARVVSLGWGVGRGQGVPSGVLPEVKRNTSWIPPSQRFQVRLEITDPDPVPLRVGMSGSVSVYTAEEHRLNPVTRGWHQFLSWLDYL